MVGHTLNLWLVWKEENLSGRSNCDDDIIIRSRLCGEMGAVVGETLNYVS